MCLYFRYPYYILQVYKFDIDFLTWLRYSIWIPLYPLGILCEGIVILRYVFSLSAFCRLDLFYSSVKLLGRPLISVLFLNSKLHVLNLKNEINKIVLFNYYCFGVCKPKTMYYYGHLYNQAKLH